MGIHYSPAVVQDGLVFYYDMGNPQKSWKGAPTTNLAPNMDIVAIQGAPTVSFVGIEDGWRKYSLNGTWNSGTYPYSVGTQLVSLTGGVTYSTSMFVKTNVPNKFATLFSGMNYVNDPMNNVGTSFSIPQPDGSFYVGRTGFQYTSSTSQIGYLLSQPVIGQSFNSATDFIFIRDGQVEAKSYPTPFVNGTRSNTQAILDLTGNRTITASSLTYHANNTFSFDGTTSILSLPYTQTSPNNFTVEALIYHTSHSLDTNIGHQIVIPYSNINAWIFSLNGPDSKLQLRHHNFNSSNTSYNVITSSGLALNTWYHVTATDNGNRVILYVNGNESANIASVVSTTNTPMTMNIGAWIGAANTYFSGIIPAVRIYNRALSALEVEQNFSALRGRYGV